EPKSGRVDAASAEAAPQIKVYKRRLTNNEKFMLRLGRHPLPRNEMTAKSKAGSLFVASFLFITASAAAAVEPIPAEHFARVPMIQQVSMSADGRNLVAIVAAPGSDNQDTALAT